MPIGATIGAAVVGGGAAIYSANKQASAMKSASNQAGQTADKEIQLQREARDSAEKELRPYTVEGDQARRMYNAAYGVAPTAGADTIGAARNAFDQGFDASPFWKDAQYSTAQAINALNSSNAALGRGGSINSGKALRAASDITQGYRGNATQNYLSGLGGIANTGYNASTGIASGGQTFATNAGNALQSAGQLQGQYAMAGAQAQAQGVADAAGFGAWAAGQYANQAKLYSYFPQTAQVSPIPAYNPPALNPVMSTIPRYSFGGA